MSYSYLTDTGDLPEDDLFCSVTLNTLENVDLFCVLFICDILHDIYSKNMHLIIKMNELKYICKITAHGISTNDNNANFWYNRIIYNMVQLLEIIKIKEYDTRNIIKPKEEPFKFVLNNYSDSYTFDIMFYENRVRNYYANKFYVNEIRNNFPNTERWQSEIDRDEQTSNDIVVNKISSDACQDPTIEKQTSVCRLYTQTKTIYKLVTLATIADTGYMSEHLDRCCPDHNETKNFETINNNALFQVNILGSEQYDKTIMSVQYRTNRLTNSRSNDRQISYNSSFTGQSKNIYINLFNKTKMKNYIKNEKWQQYQLGEQDNWTHPNRYSKQKTQHEWFCNVFDNLTCMFFGDFGQILYAKALSMQGINLYLATGDIMLSVISACIVNHPVYTYKDGNIYQLNPQAKYHFKFANKQITSLIPENRRNKMQEHNKPFIEIERRKQARLERDRNNERIAMEEKQREEHAESCRTMKKQLDDIFKKLNEITNDKNHSARKIRHNGITEYEKLGNKYNNLKNKYREMMCSAKRERDN